MRIQALEVIAAEFVKLDERRLALEKECRALKKSLETMKDDLQKMVGVAEDLNIPMVVKIGNFYITQTRKHREVKAHEYDYVEFKVIESITESALNHKG